MTYMITPLNVSFDDSYIFPDKVSWFLERVGMLRETSEFYQMQKLLDVNLSLLDHTQYNVDDDNCCIESSCDILIKMFNLLIQKIDSDFFLLTKINTDSQNLIEYLTNGEFKIDITSIVEKVIDLKSKSVSELEISYF